MTPAAERADRPSARRNLFIVFAIVVLVVIHASHKDAAAGSGIEALLAVLSFLAPLFLIGWGATWLTRRRAGRSRAEEAAEPPLLAGRALSVTRAVWLVLFTATGIVYAYTLALLWRESHATYPDTTPEGAGFTNERSFFGLTWQEQARLGSLTTWPGWYPWLVVVRQALVFIAVLAIAWSVFDRRPRHWMAYFVAAFIGLGPLLSVWGERFTHTPVGSLAAFLSIIGLLAALGFLWMFPDGRFRGTFLRYLVGTVFVLLAGCLVVGARGGDIGDVIWNVAWFAAFIFIAGGIGTQVWRYRHVPLDRAGLARWNLVVLIAVPVWLLFFGGVYGRFNRDESGVAFAWHQVLLTIYLAGPVLFGLWVLYLMRNQGWWDAQRFWRRTTVFVILTPLFLAAYVGVLAVVGVVAKAISSENGTAVAVLVATASVPFALRPAQRVVSGWVDHQFFPSRRMADETLARFTDQLRHETDPARVRDELIAVVDGALGPEHAALWITGKEK